MRTAVKVSSRKSFVSDTVNWSYSSTIHRLFVNLCDQRTTQNIYQPGFYQCTIGNMENNKRSIRTVSFGGSNSLLVLNCIVLIFRELSN